MNDLLTVADLRRLIVDRGYNSTAILTAEEAETRNTEAVYVMSLLPDGRMDVIVKERNKVLFHELYEDEPTAVREVSGLFKPFVTMPMPPPEQLARSTARQEARRREMIRELEERRRKHAP